MYNKACVCEYIGTNYSGWQRQKNASSIQGLIENILSKIYDSEVKISGSGRTDAGVHALSQVFNYKSDIYRDNKSVIRALNSYLPSDVKVYGAKDVAENFHSWLHPIAKTYEYKIINCEYPTAIYSDRALWEYQYIDVDKLNAILDKFVGCHDFASFCVAKTKKDDTIRTINYATAERQDNMIIITVNANGFLHNMVRIIVGTSLDFVKDDRNGDDIKEILLSKDRRLAGKTAPAHGLYQKEIFYSNGLSGLAGIKPSE